MSIWRINRTYRNLQRMQTILNVLLKHGFGQLIRRIGLHKLLPLGKQASTFTVDDSEASRGFSIPERLRMVLDELGPTFIKFGQVISTRPDIIPEPFIAELKKLREHATPLSFVQIRKTVEKELKESLSEVFSEFHEVALAAASIAQVHYATLKTGEKVVVKILRPGIDKVIRNDIDILYTIAGLIERYADDFARFDPVGLVREFEKTITREIDFHVEAANTVRFRKQFEDEDIVVVPRVYWDYSSKRILTMERIVGVPMDDLDSIQAAGLDQKRLASEGMRIFLRQVLEFGFFHADPHPGNILALPDGRIGIIDFGMVGRLDRNLDEGISALIIGVLEQDYDRLLRSLKELGFQFDDGVDPELKMDLREIVETYYGMPLERVDISDLILRLLSTVSYYRIRVPSNYLMLSRAMVVAEGIGRQLDPKIDVISIGKPMIKDIFKRRSDPMKLLKETVYVVGEMRRCMNVLPAHIETVFSKLKRGTLQIEFLHRNLESIGHDIERTGNRVAFGIVTGCLLLGSSLIVLADKGPYLFGMPALGLVGFASAGVAIFWLLVAIMRSGKI